MKKIAVFLLVLSMALSIMGCGGSSGDEGTTGTAEPSATQSASLPAVTDPQPSGTEPSTADTLPDVTGPSGSETLPPVTEPGTVESSPTEPDSSIAETTPTQPDPTVSTPSATVPSVTVPAETTPAKPSACSHDYKLTSTTASTCVKAGSKTYTCSKCGGSYRETLALAGHKYAAATCVKPKTCSVCGGTSGSALGHSYSGGSCTRCGAADPDKAVPVEFKITVKTDEKKKLEGVTVSVYTDTSGSSPAGVGKTDSSGVATMTLPCSSSTYTVILSDIPIGYEGKESYTFHSTVTNVTLTSLPVLDPLDHSRAKYKVGDTMADFTLTDADGNTYQLSALLKEKDLVILNFWYINCHFCNEEFPYFESVYQQYKDDIALLALDPFETNEKISAHKAEKGLSFPMLQDTVNIATGFSVKAYPTTVILDSTGKILMIKENDYKSEEALLKDIQKYLP